MSALLPFPTSMAADFLKLFMNERLTSSEPHHLEYIKGRLAHMKIEDPKGYEHYSAHYGVGVDVEVTKEPGKKRGRPAKVEVIEAPAEPVTIPVEPA